MKRRLIRLAVRILSAAARRPTAFPSAPRILVPAYAGLGNFILMTPLFRVLRATWPEADVHLVAGNPWGAEFVLRGSHLVDRIRILRDDTGWAGKLAFFWKLRREKFDIAFLPFDASPSFYWLGTLLAGIPIRVGHTFDVLKKDMSWTRAVLTREVPLRVRAHETDLHLDLLDALLPRPCARTYETHVEAEASLPVLEKFGLKPRDYVVFQISAADARPSAKRWPLEHFVELARRFHAASLPIVLLGNRFDLPLVGQFVARCTVAVSNLTGRTSIGEATAIIAQASVLVCHDSGLMHIGNAVGTPLVALYGPTDVRFTRPMAPTSRVLRNEALPCIGCMKDFQKTEEEALADCPIGFECMRSLSPSTVFEAAMKIRRR